MDTKNLQDRKDGSSISYNQYSGIKKKDIMGIGQNNNDKDHRF